ncbi:Rieske 2Fe-2S domain-containing protein [Pseudomonas asiatica]|uniref:Rieske 2Fe-2S domain-containing protein n=1 Tax=Pseudomonas TaxID=286 RepID=UPI00209B7078|nr:Rieske 2Fe-2S domain-containing protein [Pseudomonas asiatica]MCO7526726.1 Rieske 2Fe-2S domain-containing protein [Pseudomonas asiatica]
MNKVDLNQWFPIATPEDLPKRHVFHATLMGQELAIWRDDNGVVNVWENRCPHRGLRLTLGANTGSELRCQYHGWTYETGTGGCTFVPAHRDATEPSKARVNTFPAREKHGLIWTSLGQPVGEPISILDDAQLVNAVKTNLHSTVIATDVDCLIGVLRANLSAFVAVFGVDDVEDLHLKTMQQDRAILVSRTGSIAIHLYLQRATVTKTLVHAQALTSGRSGYELQKNFAFAMNSIRRSAEAETSELISIKDISDQTIEEVEAVKENLTKAPPSQYLCEVVTRTQETGDINSYWLKPIGHPMPAFAAGMHISITTPEGCIRQYSLVNAPDEQESFIIGVKKELQSRGGSKSMHEEVKVGTQLKVTLPRNGFPYVQTGKRPILVAGGIGITPILCMAQALSQQDTPFEIHYFARGAEHVPFQDRLTALGESLNLHFGLGPEETKAKLSDILFDHEPGSVDIYTCGPQPMIETVSAVALAHGVSEDSIRFEFFSKKNDAPVSDEEYEVELSKTGQSFIVPSGATLLQACLENNVQIEASCEQGVCGTCITAVISGDIEHHDTYLSKKERESGKWIMPCVSRCKSKKIVLDL